MSSRLSATDDEVGAIATYPSTTSARWPRKETLSARLRRPWFLVAWSVTVVALVMTTLEFREQHLLRLTATVAFVAVNAGCRHRDFRILDTGASLLLRRRTALTEEILPTEVAGDQIECIRPRHSNPIIRFVRPEIWRLAEQRFVIDSKRLSAVLQRLTGASAS